MNRLIKLLTIVTLVVTVLILPGSPVFAEDGITVDIDIEGDSPVVNVEADGDNATVFINGQDIEQPTVYSHYYAYENNYNDTFLVNSIYDLQVLLSDTETNLITTSEGLVNVIQVIGEHTTNLQELLEYAKTIENGSVDRDNELAGIGREQDDRIQSLAISIDSLIDMVNNNSADIERISDDIKRLDKETDELKLGLNTALLAIVIVFSVYLVALLCIVFYFRTRR